MAEEFSLIKMKINHIITVTEGVKAVLKSQELVNEIANEFGSKVVSAAPGSYMEIYEGDPARNKVRIYRDGEDESIIKLLAEEAKHGYLLGALSILGDYKPKNADTKVTRMSTRKRKTNKKTRLKKREKRLAEEAAKKEIRRRKKAEREWRESRMREKERIKAKRQVSRPASKPRKPTTKKPTTKKPTTKKTTKKRSG